MRMLVAALAFCSGLACASSTTTDFTDLWYNSNEEGWGANVIHQRDTLFITLFVYGQNQQPTWYVASDVRLVSTANGVFTYNGILYRTTGPWFAAGSFNEANVAVVPVGTVTFLASQVNQATLSYTVDGASISKVVTRQTWAEETLAGSYIGATIGTWSNCSNRTGSTEDPVTITVNHVGSTVSLREDGNGYTCTYTGTYSQAGRMGTVTGNGTCSDGVNQAFVMSEVTPTAQSLSMRFTAAVGACTFAGRMGGMRRGS